MEPPLKYRDTITSRLKVMAKLDIAERRLPQDGRIKLRLNADGAAREIDFRVSCLPTLHGEKVVLRLLRPQQADARHDPAGPGGRVAEAARRGRFCGPGGSCS